MRGDLEEGYARLKRLLVGLWTLLEPAGVDLLRDGVSQFVSWPLPDAAGPAELLRHLERTGLLTPHSVSLLAGLCQLVDCGGGLRLVAEYEQQHGLEAARPAVRHSAPNDPRATGSGGRAETRASWPQLSRTESILLDWSTTEPNESPECSKTEQNEWPECFRTEQNGSSECSGTASNESPECLRTEQNEWPECFRTEMNGSPECFRTEQNGSPEWFRTEPNRTGRPGGGSEHAPSGRPRQFWTPPPPPPLAAVCECHHPPQTACRPGWQPSPPAGPFSVQQALAWRPSESPVAVTERRRRLVEFLAGRLGRRCLQLGARLRELRQPELDALLPHVSRDPESCARRVLLLFFSRQRAADAERQLSDHIRQCGCHRLADQLDAWLRQQDQRDRQQDDRDRQRSVWAVRPEDQSRPPPVRLTCC